MTEDNVRTQGKVKWFNDVRGFGFIEREDDDLADDLFVHISAVEGKGLMNLIEGQTVEFEIVQGTKGLQASRVSVI